MRTIQKRKTTVAPTSEEDRRRLSREERTLCRALRSRGIPKKSLSQHFRCSESTIKRAVGNEYLEPDNLNEGILPADFEEVFRAVESKRNVRTAKKADRRVRNRQAIIDRPDSRRNDVVATSAGAESHRAPSVQSNSTIAEGVSLEQKYVLAKRKAGWTREKLPSLDGPKKSFAVSPRVSS
ncbi:hypothetical protein B0H11DRAFT_2076279 [Mycena galericulata]|nr:hypothetical protein B0H11DRAFT_2076279 [Mycena galericulata]